MKFSKVSSLFLAFASAVSAFTHEPIVARDSELIRDEAAAKQFVGDVELGMLDRRGDLDERETYPEADPEVVESTNLVTRDILSDAEEEIISYLRKIKTPHINGPASWPTTWTDLHGDNKSKFGGRYVCRVRYSNGKYEAQVVAHDVQPKDKKKKPVILVGYVFGTTTVGECVDKKCTVTEPTYARAIHFLRKHFGGANPLPTRSLLEALDGIMEVSPPYNMKLRQENRRTHW